jgi:hypothetical protein
MTAKRFATPLMCLIAGIGLAMTPAAWAQKADGGKIPPKATANKAGVAKTDSAKPGHTVDQAVIETVVRDLLDGLGRRQRQADTARDEKSTAEQWYEASSWYVREKIKDLKGEIAVDPRRKIALWPFWKDGGLPVDADFARVLGFTLRALLVNDVGADYKVVTREELLRLENEIDEFNILKVSAEKTNTLIRGAGADVLVVIHLIPNDVSSVMVSASAQEVLKGVTLAEAAPRALPYDFDTAANLSLEQSLRQAASFFIDKRPDVQTLRPQGLRFQDSKVQTPFGKWYAERFNVEINRAAHRIDPGRTITIAEAAIPASRIKSRGLDLIEKPIAGMMTEERPGDYVVQGVYWDLGDAIDMQLRLTDAKGGITAWQGYIRKSSIGAPLLKTLEPKSVPESDSQPVGPIGFTLASELGEDPVYRIGQKLVLLIQASRESYLYCFYKQADGAVMKIFPNQAHENARVAGKAVQKIPSSSMSFEWRVAEPPGTEQVKCFATDRDIGKHLPAVIREQDFLPLPYKALSEISRIFRQLPAAAIAEARMVINVER